MKFSRQELFQRESVQILIKQRSEQPKQSNYARQTQGRNNLCKHSTIFQYVFLSLSEQVESFVKNSIFGKLEVLAQEALLQSS
jgi:hypothetical protein